MEEIEEVRVAIETVTVGDDDNPEDLMGCESVGRARMDQKSLEDLGRICHQFGRI